MYKEESLKLSLPLLLAARTRDLSQLLKVRLSFLVVFSSVVGYLLVPGVTFNWSKVILLFLGGMLVTGSASAINEILERDVDKVMKRTATRPLPDGRMSVAGAWSIALISGIAGLAIMLLGFNLLSAIVSLASLLIYAFAYTPLKKIHSIAVLVGAIPGALPPLIGWAAGANDLGMGGWILFTIQFIWQFPHLWSIGWLGHDDYQKAGLKLLPATGKTRATAWQTVMYALVLIPLSYATHMAGMTGMVSVIIVALAGFFYTWRSVEFYKHADDASARKLMFASFIYLPVALLAMLFDKIV